MKITALFLLSALVCVAETRTLTLKQALQLALQQNPDLIITRLDERKAQQQVNINKDPFTPKVNVGSGLAWAYGFPSSIDGSAPSIFQARTTMSIYDKSQSYLVEQAKGTATSEGQRLVEAAKQQIELEASHAREALRREVAAIAIGAATKVLEREIDARTHADLLSKLATQSPGATGTGTLTAACQDQHVMVVHAVSGISAGFALLVWERRNRKAHIV